MIDLTKKVSKRRRRPSDDYTRPITFRPTQKTPSSPIKAAAVTGWHQSGSRRTRGGGSGSSASDRTTSSSLLGLDDLAPGHPGELFHHLRPRRPADLLGGRPLHEERRLERRAGLLAKERDPVAARLRSPCTGR